MEEVELSDVYGRVALRIGMSSTDVVHKSGTKLLLKMEHPRTDFLDWGHFTLIPEEGKALYEDILIDIRNILERFCEDILKRTLRR